MYLKPVIFRADAGNAIGVGHVMRALVLAEKIVNNGGRAVFVLNADAIGLIKGIQLDNYEIHTVISETGSKSDMETTVGIAQSIAAEWVIVDGYDFDSTYQDMIRARGLKVLYIDDMGHLERYPANIILNQNMYANERMYPNRSGDTKLLLGSDYVLLRNEFEQYRNRFKNIPERAENVMITFGGSDPTDATLRVLKSLSEIREYEFVLKVVVGVENKKYKDIIALAMRMPVETEVIYNTSEMAKIMDWSDLAISSSGTTSWELAYMGVPSILIAIAGNQIKIAEALDKKGISIRLRETNEESCHNLNVTFTRVLRLKHVRATMSLNGRRVVDGFGADRVFGVLAENLIN